LRPLRLNAVDFLKDAKDFNGPVDR